MEKTLSQKVSDDVNKFKTKYAEGFTHKEVDELLKRYPDINMSKFNEAIMGITCLLKEDTLIMYHHDIKKAIICGMENRSLRLWEWD